VTFTEIGRNYTVVVLTSHVLMNKPLQCVTHCQYDARHTVTFSAAGYRCRRAYDRYQIIPLGDRGASVWTTCPVAALQRGRPGVKLVTPRVASQHLNIRAPVHNTSLCD